MVIFHLCAITCIYTYVHMCTVPIGLSRKAKFHMHNVYINVCAFKNKYFNVCMIQWGSVLQCVAVCCSVLQCVAVCCSVLQCVAVCCSVLQCDVCMIQWGWCVRRSLNCTALCTHCNMLQHAATHRITTVTHCNTL